MLSSQITWTKRKDRRTEEWAPSISACINKGKTERMKLGKEIDHAPPRVREGDIKDLRSWAVSLSKDFSTRRGQAFAAPERM